MEIVNDFNQVELVYSAVSLWKQLKKPKQKLEENKTNQNHHHLKNKLSFK